jgi:formate-dependent nitrite reductase membrane component NrfD
MTRRNDGGSLPPARSYHGQPVIKEPVWTWEIPTYFFVGGAAGASAGLAYLSEVRGETTLARRAWATALACVMISPALLTSDLGQPRRFINMLRTFKVTSPMSVGSWILFGSGPTTALAAFASWTERVPRVGRIAKPAAALLGLPLSTYTGALIANTAVPVWHESRRLLPFVFGSGAALSAGAIAVTVNDPTAARQARRLALGAAAVEGPLMELMIHRVGVHGEVYKHGVPGKLANLSRGFIIGGTALLYGRGGSSQQAARIAGMLLGGGAMAARWCIFRAGFSSARDPSYVTGPQRAAIERGERRGAPRRSARIGSGSFSLGSPATTVRSASAADAEPG